LGLLKEEGELLSPDFSDLETEKMIILGENKQRSFRPFEKSPPLTEKEIEAMLRVVLKYERGRDYLRWFLDFSKFPEIRSFDVSAFRKYAEPIFILGKIERGKKASHVLKREVDGRIWRIPNNNPYDYTRLASFTFPSWFKELGVIDKATVFPDFSDDKNFWHMYYPIKLTEKEFEKHDISRFLESLFAREKTKRIWTPYLLFIAARTFCIPMWLIKKRIEKTCKDNVGTFYLERAPLHLIQSKYRDSYIEMDGFVRSYLYCGGKKIE
jgi:hypothetical protein